MKQRNKIIYAAIGVLLFAGLSAPRILRSRRLNIEWRTAQVEKGDLKVTVTATGTLSAVTTVQVGSQVSGTLAWLGADFNSRVKRGQVIARLDPAVFQAQVENARASVLNAQAAIQAALTDINNQKANLLAVKANQRAAKVAWEDAMAVVRRYKELQTLIPGRDMEAAQAQANTTQARYEQATSQIVQAQAAYQASNAKLKQAKASLAQAKAQLNQNMVNLNHTIIASPVDGVVISRNVDAGQTVAASLQAPTLFTIANDLTKMQVQANIDEADIGTVKVGQKVAFSVDAYADETFDGTVAQIRLQPVIVQNVVTYTVIINVANAELKLMPGMTANISIGIKERKNVLKVPTHALRFSPPDEYFKKKRRFDRMEEQKKNGRPDMQKDKGGPAKQVDLSPGSKGKIWLKNEKELSPLDVTIGLSDGTFSEIQGNLQPGQEVVVGFIGAEASNPTQQNPLGMRQRRR